MYLRCFQIILNFSFSHPQQQDKISSPKKIQKKRDWGDLPLPAPHTGWKIVTPEVVSNTGGWGALYRSKKRVKENPLEASDEEHKQKSPNLVETHIEAVPVEVWEVTREAISPEIESSTATTSNTWVAGFIYFSTALLKSEESPDYHKYNQRR